MGTVTKLERQMKKDELARHLEGDHGLHPITLRWTTRAELADTHRLVHIYIGRSADHTHGTGR